MRSASRARRPFLIAVAAAAVVGTTLTIPASAIVDGSPVADGTHSYLARITVGSELSCTGALIDPHWVITASDCLPAGKAATAVIGRTKAGQTTGVSREITQVVPRADRGIALARLKYPIMELPKLKLATTPAGAGEVLKVAGWGRTRQTFANDQLHTASFSVDSSNGENLAVTGQSGTGLCKGDAGGPAFREVNGVAELVAVGTKSFQGGCYGVAETRTGATAGRVDNLGTWIAQTINGRTVMFKNLFNGRCMLHWSGEPQAGSTVKQFDCHPQYYDQAWELKPVSGGVALRNAATGLCASARTATDNFGTTVPMRDCNANDSLQTWQVNPLSNGVQIRHVVTGRCLAVWHGTPGNGAEASQQVCEPAYIDQVWTEIA